MESVKFKFEFAYEFDCEYSVRSLSFFAAFNSGGVRFEFEFEFGFEFKYSARSPSFSFHLLSISLLWGGGIVPVRVPVRVRLRVQLWRASFLSAYFFGGGG